MPIPGAIPFLIGGGISAIGSVLGGNAQASATKQAANTSAQANREALDFKKETYNKQLELSKPYRDIGERALTILNSELDKPIGFTQSDLFYNQETNKALDRRLAGLGLIDSGNAIREDLGLNFKLQDRAQARRDSVINSSLGLGKYGSQLGFNAATDLGNFGVNAIQNIGITNANSQLANGAIQAGNYGNIANLGIGLGNLFLNPGNYNSGFSGYNTTELPIMYGA